MNILVDLKFSKLKNQKIGANWMVHGKRSLLHKLRNLNSIPEFTNGGRREHISKRSLASQKHGTMCVHIHTAYTQHMQNNNYE